MNEPQPGLREAYACIAELWLNPRESGMEEARKRARQVAAALASSDPEAAAALCRFVERSVSEEEYVELFELDPRCPLYLGSHVFEEPKTCAEAAVCERNDYMIELLGIYRHLGFSPNGKELPDYLPLMVEFLSLTAESDDPVRRKFVNDYLLPYLAPIRSRLESLATPYVHLLEALERVLQADLRQAQRVGHV